MIFAIESVEQDKEPELIDEMFRMRAEVFSGRLSWDVTVENGREIDRFDAEEMISDSAYGLAKRAYRL